jgi:hypothetical protein
MPDDPLPQPLDSRSPPQRKPPNDPESERWRNYRILFRIAIILLIAPPTIYFGSNMIMFGKLTGLSAADFIPDVQNKAVPVVLAIKKYQRDTGQLPNQITDLPPKYLPSTSNIEGDIQAWGTPHFTLYNTIDNQRIVYDFTPGAEGWSTQGYFVNGPIPLPPVTLAPSTQPVPQPK